MYIYTQVLGETLGRTSKVLPEVLPLLLPQLVPLLFPDSRENFRENFQSSPKSSPSTSPSTSFQIRGGTLGRTFKVLPKVFPKVLPPPQFCLRSPLLPHYASILLNYSKSSMKFALGPKFSLSSPSLGPSDFPNLRHISKISVLSSDFKVPPKFSLKLSLRTFAKKFKRNSKALKENFPKFSLSSPSGFLARRALGHPNLLSRALGQLNFINNN